MQIKTKPCRAVERRHTKLDSKRITDQSYKKHCDINNVVGQFLKTGIMPTSTKIPQYGDFSDVATLEDTFLTVNEAREAFYQLPATIRKLIDNDPSKLELFIKNPENKEICLKFGLLEAKTQVNHKSPETKLDSNDAAISGKENEFNSKETN